MTLLAITLAALGFGLAFVNGANDVSKGIATLVGCGIANYRRAIAWGTLWTAVGGLVGAVLATAMVTTFGNGLLAPGTTQTVGAGVATLLGAAAWVLIATRTGLPVSTTHAIVGSLVGVAAVAYGVDGVRWSALGGKVVLPLLLSPVLALVFVTLLLKATRPSTVKLAGRAAARMPDCLCAEVTQREVALAGPSSPAAAWAMAAPRLQLIVDTRASCAVERPQAASLTLDHLHWLTAGAASLARGMNDAPKIVALVLAASALGVTSTVGQAPLFMLVTAGMVLGSLVGGRRVTRLLAEKVTPMDHREGFLANLVTAALVTAGATLGLPMSTTHVSAGGIVGAGAQRSSLDKKTLGEMALAWVTTLPAAAVLGICALLVGRWLS
ncbi:MAG: inorganic phosphate transporter [Deltaproteobacteria bacterium]|nr:inorganic phosphate transporter [Deltaproteobacteria bacterium]